MGDSAVGHGGLLFELRRVLCNVEFGLWGPWLTDFPISVPIYFEYRNKQHAKYPAFCNVHWTTKVRTAMVPALDPMERAFRCGVDLSAVNSGSLL